MYRIFIVEDDPGLAEGIAQMVRAWGMDARVAGDFRRVAQEFAEYQPHLAVLDISLPFFNGYYWCQEIRKFSKVPLLFLSSAADNMNIVMAMNLGADDIDPNVFDNGLSDDIFEKIIACIRIAVPYTGMIISTRENEEVRRKVLHLGISQISGGSRTSVGGYAEEERPHDSEQFDVSDQRTLDEVVRWLMEMDFIPSFCTACYREGRTGDRFMSLCKSGQILNCCHPNALMTLTEYLVDYASPETRAVGFPLIERELRNIPKDKVRQIATEYVADIQNSNRRDFRF